MRGVGVLLRLAELEGVEIVALFWLLLIHAVQYSHFDVVKLYLANYITKLNIIVFKMLK